MWVSGANNSDTARILAWGKLRRASVMSRNIGAVGGIWGEEMVTR